MKNITALKRSGNKTKRKLKQKFTRLTDSNTLFSTGKQGELSGTLLVTLAQATAEIKKIIADL